MKETRDRIGKATPTTASHRALRPASSLPRRLAVAVPLALALCLAALPAAPAGAAVPARPFLETFGSAAQPAFALPEALAFDAINGDLLAVEGEDANETQELRIEAAENLGGTYELCFEGPCTGWEGEATLTSGETTITGAQTLAGKLVNGEQISGTGIQPGTIVGNVNEAAGTFTLTQPATASGTFADLEADLSVQSSEVAIINALGGLSTIGGVGGGVSAGNKSNEPSLTVWQIKFGGSLGQKDVALLGCDGAGLTGTSPSCSVEETFPGHPSGVYRYHKDGTPAPFPALGTNVIDGQLGYGAKPCAEEASSCDVTPQGELGPVGAVAVDESGTATDGDIYLALPDQKLVAVFAPDGHYLGQITKYVDGGVEKSLGATEGVAVDAAGSLYVTDFTFGKVRRYVSQGAPHNPLLNSDSVANFTVAGARSVAAGRGPTAGSIFAADNGGNVKKLDSATGALRFTIPVGTFGYRSVALNPADGRLFVVAPAGVNEYDASGPSSATLVSQALPPQSSSRATGIAVDPADGALYVARNAFITGEHHLEVYGPSLRPSVVTKPISALTGTGATLNGTVNPNGKTVESCVFEWGTTTAPYQHAEPCAESLGEIGSGAEPVAVHLDLSGLVAGTAYHYRLTAKNEVGASEGSDSSFFTPHPPAIEDESVQSVTGDEAVLAAQINPEGFATTYTVEYGTTEAYGESATVRSLGPTDTSPHPVSVVLEGLAPATTYHFRFVADNTDASFPGTGAETGEDRTFTTFTTFTPFSPQTDCPNQAFRSGASAALPDCRAYELVSPLDKEGGNILDNQFIRNTYEVLNQASLSGDKLAFGSYTAFGDADTSPYTSQYVASRTAAGWRSHFILGRRGRSNTSVDKQTQSELRALSPDLCQAWQKTYTEPKLAPNALAQQMNLYRRLDQEPDCGGAEGWEALTTAEPQHGTFFRLEFQGASVDAGEAIYYARDNLAGTAAPNLSGQEFALYYQEAGEGQPRFVCYGTDGTPIAASCAAGATGIETDGHRARAANLTGAISADGQRVFWTTPAPGSGKIYLREHPGRPQSEVSGGLCTEPDKACTIAVSAAGEAASGTTTSFFWLASDQGTKAIYTTGGTLYEFLVDSKETHPIADQVLGVMGASADASRVYFASEEVLTAAPNAEGKSPLAGEANLYLAEAGSFRFIATLVGADDPSLENSAIAAFPVDRSSRVSADGLHAAFLSTAPLTGYDNTDAHSPAPCGQPAGRCDAEVFLYDAAANEGEGGLICASCNPSGARPAGRLSELGATTTFWAAAELPVWQTGLYPGRLMSEDGSRLFFESADVLTPRDTNGAVDVYQWQAPGGEPGEGRCTESSPSYSARNEGCLSLISSGHSAADSHLLDLDPTGRDVFFTTAESLLPQDYGLVDAYDARLGGGLPESGPPPPGCEGEACQSALEAPSDPTPASSSFEGAGNVTEPAARPRCTKGKVRKRGRCVKRPRKIKSKRDRRAAGANRRADR